MDGRFLKIICALTYALVTSIVSAQTEKAPEISTHSATSFAVYQGDKISLNVSTEDVNDQIKWSRNGQVICEGHDCHFTTDNWSVGKHFVVATVANGIASVSLKYTITILSRPIDVTAIDITPNTIVVQKTFEKLKKDDLSASADFGIGYIYGDEKSETIGKQARKIKWNEKITTHKKGQVVFGILNKEEHFLLRGSSALLTTNKTGTRTINLLRGKLRSRHLAKLPPNWQIKVGKWLTLEGDGSSDLIVEIKRNPQVTAVITVLRGNINVFYQPLSESEETSLVGKSEKQTLSQGWQTKINKFGGQKVATSLVKNPDFEKLIFETTPYFVLTDEGEDFVESSKRRFAINSHKKLSFRKAIVSAQTAINQKDYLLALAYLVPYEDQAPTNFDLSILIAIASKGIFLKKQAIQFFETAKLIRKRDPLIYFEKGELHLTFSEWKTACQDFDLAQDYDFPEEQILSYYLGVCNYQQDHFVSAHKNFTYSLWDDSEQDVTTSSQKYLEEIERKKHFYMSFTLGAFYEDNIFHLPEKSLLPEDYTTNESAGYLSHVSLDVFLLKRESLAWNLQIDAEYRGFTSVGVSQFSILAGKVSSKITKKFLEESSSDTFFELGMTPELITETWAGTAVFNELAVKAYFGLPSLFSQPELYFRPALRSGVEGEDLIFDKALERRPTNSANRDQEHWMAGFNLTPVKLDSYRLDLVFGTGVTNYTDKNAETDSFTENQIALNNQMAFSKRLKLFLDAKYQERVFYKSEENSDDSSIDIRAILRWYYSPLYRQDVTVSYYEKTSQIDLNSYDRLFLSLNFSVAI